MDYNILIENLINTSIGVGLFLTAYFANMSFSLYYNIKIMKEDFDRDKIKDSGIKVLTFVFGTLFLCTAVTLIPQFSNAVGFEVPQEYSEVFADLAILGVFLYTGCRYSYEAYIKMKSILQVSKLKEEDE